MEVDDPSVQITVEGDGGIAVAGAGPQQVRLRPGMYRVRASQDGQALPETLVTISRGGREIVTIRRPQGPTGSPVDASAPNRQPLVPDKEPFVVLDAKGAVRGGYGSLADAVGNSQEGETIEIRGNGPFASEPISLSTRRTIRAGQGFVPVIKSNNAAVRGPLHVLQTERRSFWKGSTSTILIAATASS